MGEANSITVSGVGHIPFPSGHRFQNLTGMRFCRLLVEAFAGQTRSGSCRWQCLCECGNRKTIDAGTLKKGEARSCGCLQRELVAARSRTHGHRKLPEYPIWVGIITRCENKGDKSYARYGARGIKICRRWRESFEAFFQDMGPRPSPRHSIDRIDNGGNYEPGNCRWATTIEQGRNKATNRVLTMDGRSQPLSAWAEEFDVSYTMVHDRLNKGWDLRNALTTAPTPIGKRRWK